MYKLRDYQQDLEDRIFELWVIAIRSIMVQLPTGGGKTKTFGSIVDKQLKIGWRVLVIAHREELIFQAKKTIEEASGHPAGVIKSGYKPSPLFPLQVASIQTLTKYEIMPPADLIIIDEAHHACSRSYTRVMEQYPNAKILGFTATPCRNDGQGFKYLFEKLICGPTTRELIELGHLCPYQLFEAGKTIDTSKVKKDSEGGDFNVKQLSETVGRQIEPDDVVQEWLDKAKGKRTVVFAVDIEKSKEYAEAFCRYGIPAEHLDGKTEKDDRRDILNRFELGETLILCNCGIVSEGVDIPGIEAILIVRPTGSLSLWRQMAGRAFRPAKDKEFAIIVDFSQARARKRLGLPDDDVDWSLEPQSLDELGKRFFSVTCECNHVFRPLPHEIRKLICNCPNCLKENTFKMGKGEKQEPEEIFVVGSNTGKAIDLTVNPEHQLIIDKLLCDCDRIGHSKKDWVYHKFMKIAQDWKAEISMGTWRYLAKKLGYTTKWATKKYQEIEEENRELTPVELDRLWKKAVEAMRPYSTQALLDQHGRLVEYKNSKACIEIKSPQLLKIANTDKHKKSVSVALHSVGSFASVVQFKVKARVEEEAIEL
ncbi:DEAD/DEAH box helicase family protein [Microcoleus sp. herbarium7]|uniref:DEAD/DEAH box helicase n=1 Tax=Microcoleus sp. herbarium7 TaxID=3055435 RepID=UPI002FD27F7E